MRRSRRSKPQTTVIALERSVAARAYSMIESDRYTVDGTTGKVSELLEKSSSANGIGASHKLTQSTSALQCAVPAPSGTLFGQRPVLTFVDQRYSSSAAPSAWSFLHDGTGATVYLVCSFDGLAGSKYVLATSYAGGAVGWNMGHAGGTALACLVSNGGAIAVPSGGTLSTSTAYQLRYRYAEGVSPEVDLYAQNALVTSENATSGAPSSSDPVATLMLGNRPVVVDAPWSGKFAACVVMKGAYSIDADTIVRRYFALKYRLYG